jgi:alpha-L-rhamnosidase
MYEYQLGITAEGGYKHFILQPTAGASYTSLTGSYRSNYGDIVSAWKADGKGKMTAYEATVPANTTATLYLPVGSNVSQFGTANGVRYVGKVQHNGITTAQYELQSGHFNFTIGNAEVTVR